MMSLAWAPFPVFPKGSSTALPAPRLVARAPAAWLLAERRFPRPVLMLPVMLLGMPLATLLTTVLPTLLADDGAFNLHEIGP
jgi:hypothetical protein